MLTKTEKQFSILFVIIVLVELYTGSSDTLRNWHYFAKPAIVISLIIFFLKAAASIPKRIKTLTVLGLLFSVMGDTLLMFVDKSEHYFTFGLIAFLTAHIMYILAFLKHRNKQRSVLGILAILLLYALAIFYFLIDHLGTMLIPVILYMLVILLMATTAYLRKGTISLISYQLVFLGALFFVVSDSILALNKFYQPIPFSDYSIMITYALAQYLIVIGILKLKLD